jgi:hypothetical protein
MIFITKIKQELPMSFSDEISTKNYTLRVKGILTGLDWSGWFGDMTVEQDVERGETIIQGMIVDPAELYGLISRLRNLGLTLISVESVKKDES